MRSGGGSMQRVRTAAACAHHSLPVSCFGGTPALVCTRLSLLPPQFGDIERLDVVDEYAELSRKTARLFSHMSGAVVADFYFKIDDDVGGCWLFKVPAMHVLLVGLGGVWSGTSATTDWWVWLFGWVCLHATTDATCQGSWSRDHAAEPTTCNGVSPRMRPPPSHPPRT